MSKGKKKQKPKETEISFYSFWKPEPIPPRDGKAHSVQLLPIGSIKEVVTKIFRIPNILVMAYTPSMISRIPVIRMVWEVGGGVALQVRAEYGEGKCDKVYTIAAVSGISDRDFYPLFVQLHEHLEVILFDEITHSFITTADFKKMTC